MFQTHLNRCRRFVRHPHPSTWLLVLVCVVFFLRFNLFFPLQTRLKTWRGAASSFTLLVPETVRTPGNSATSRRTRTASTTSGQSKFILWFCRACGLFYASGMFSVCLLVTTHPRFFLFFFFLHFWMFHAISEQLLTQCILSISDSFSHLRIIWKEEIIFVCLFQARKWQWHKKGCREPLGSTMSINEVSQGVP